MHNPPTVHEIPITELVQIALDTKRFTVSDIEDMRSAFHNENLFRSVLSQKIKHELHSMMMKGTFTLCSRRESPCPVHG